MRLRWRAVGATLACLVVMSGPARADPGAPGTELTADGYGVVIGSPDARVRLEIFCEPQCPDCAQFESASSADIAGQLGAGRLRVTYRWLTFLDDKHDTDKSARIANALVSAADPATTATGYQALVAEVYRHRDPRGNGPETADIAAMARAAGLPTAVVDRIAAGQAVVDTTAMNVANRVLLNQLSPQSPTTPTVYDLKTDNVVDIDEPGWLPGLFKD